MPVKTTVKFKRSQLRSINRLFKDFPKKAPRALSRAFRRTGNTVRVRVVKAITADLNVKQRDIYQKGNRRRPVTQPQTSTPANIREHIAVDGGRIPLGRFAARQKFRKSKGGRRGVSVSYKIRKRGSRATIKNAFIPEVDSGYKGVFRRRGKKRYPLLQLFGPSVPHVAERQPAVKQLVTKDAAQLAEQNIASQVQLLLSNRRGSRA